MGPLVIVVCLVLSGAISREISKKLKVDIRTVSLCLGMLLAYVLTHYGLEKKTAQYGHRSCPKRQRMVAIDAAGDLCIRH